MDPRLKAVSKLRELKDEPDVEARHSHADDVLCSLLIKLGYSDVVEEYNKIDKWYA